MFAENNNGLKLYIKQLKTIPLLNAEEELALAKRYAEGDAQARETLVQSNLRLVIAIAKHYYAQNHSISFEDLIQEGNIGLMVAIEKYDYTRGWRLSTYATYWIKQSISRAIANYAKTIRIPVHMQELKAKYNKAQSELRNNLGREATTQEIAKFMGVKLDKVKEIEEMIKDPVSLSTPLNDEDDGELEDIIADPNASKPDDNIDNEIISKRIQAILATLDPRERDIINERFGLLDGTPKTLEYLGNVYGISKERIRQIEQKALRKLRNPKRAEALKPFLD